jgi:hypothetical protein
MPLSFNWGNNMPKKITKTLYSYQELQKLAKKGKVTATVLDKARQKLADWATEDEWYDTTISDWETALSQVGFENAKIQFSGFWCQGDGASFTANIDLEKLTDFLMGEIQPQDFIGGDKLGEEDWRPYIVHKLGGVRGATRNYRRLMWAANQIDDLKVERISHQSVHEYSCRVSMDLRDRGEYTPRTKITGDDSEWKSRTPRIRAIFDEFKEDAGDLRQKLCRIIYRVLEEEYYYLVSDEGLAETESVEQHIFTKNGNFESGRYP